MPKLLTQGVSSEPETGRSLIGIVAGFRPESAATLSVSSTASHRRQTDHQAEAIVSVAAEEKAVDRRRKVTWSTA